MLISFVVRLAPAALGAGLLAGEVEHVASGERGQFRDAVELCVWCAQHIAAVPAPRGAAPRSLPSSTADPGAPS